MGPHTRHKYKAGEPAATESGPRVSFTSTNIPVATMRESMTIVPGSGGTQKLKVRPTRRPQARPCCRVRRVVAVGTVCASRVTQAKPHMLSCTACTRRSHIGSCYQLQVITRVRASFTSPISGPGLAFGDRAQRTIAIFIQCGVVPIYTADGSDDMYSLRDSGRRSRRVRTPCSKRWTQNIRLLRAIHSRVLMSQNTSASWICLFSS